MGESPGLLLHVLNLAQPHTGDSSIARVTSPTLPSPILNSWLSGSTNLNGYRRIGRRIRRRWRCHRIHSEAVHTWLSRPSIAARAKEAIKGTCDTGEGGPAPGPYGTQRAAKTGIEHKRVDSDVATASDGNQRLARVKNEWYGGEANEVSTFEVGAIRIIGLPGAGSPQHAVRTQSV